MQAKVFKSGDIKPFSRSVLEIKKYVDDHEKLSVATVKIDGDDGTTTDKLSDTFDYVIEGSGNFVIDGAKHEVEKGDLVFVPKGIPFSHSGRMTLLAMHAPPFNPDNIKFEESDGS